MTPPVLFTIVNTCDSRQRVLVAFDTAIAEGPPLHDRVIHALQRSYFQMVPGIAVRAVDEKTGAATPITPIGPGNVLGVVATAGGAIALTPQGKRSHVTPEQCGVVNLLPHLVTTHWYVDGVPAAILVCANQNAMHTFQAFPVLLFLAATPAGPIQRYVVPPSVGEVTVTLVANGMFLFHPPSA